MPDVFIPADTSNYSDYYRGLVRKGLVNSYTLEYSDKNRTRLFSEYKTFEDFKKRFSFTSAEIDDFIKKGEDSGLKYDEAQFSTSKDEILQVMKALIASNLWQTNEYFRILNEDDTVIDKALQIVTDKTAYNKILGY